VYRASADETRINGPHRQEHGRYRRETERYRRKPSFCDSLQ
jgi:hypothetical protein